MSTVESNSKDKPESKLNDKTKGNIKGNTKGKVNETKKGAMTGMQKVLPAGKFYYLLKSMRPAQWTKNGFVFAGLIFSRSFLEFTPVIKTILAFIIFSIVSGSVYIINDVIDREKDKLHPVKSRRPIASGKVKPYEAVLFSIVLAVIALILSLQLERLFLVIIASYLSISILYSIKLKNVIILDVLVIASGFVLRTIGGALAIRVFISPWLIVCTTLLALFLALNKRKNELLTMSADAVNHRKTLEEYTSELIGQMLSVITSATVMSYLLYTFNSGKSQYIMLTVPFVLYGIFRYQYLVSVKDMGGNPEIMLLKDKPLLLNLILWVISCIIIVVYFY